MPPAATYDDPEDTGPVVARTKAGRALEAISDAIDEVNILKAQNKNHTAGTPEASPSSTSLVTSAEKDPAQFRRYADACDRVRAFYREQHTKQTVAYNRAARARFHDPNRRRPRLGIWAAMQTLDALTDDSDPDTELSQLQHLLQTAEALRRDGRPRWMQATGLVHDLGKLVLVFGDAPGQWSVVGDTFPVGCAFDRAAIVYPDTWDGNPDAADPVYATRHGIYAPHCGLDAVMLSWGHDEYLYHVLRDQSRLPAEGLAMVRYHSFYAWHREGGYRHLMNDKDYALLAAVRAFNPYDLYSKSDAPPDVEALKPYYMELIDEFFPPVIEW
ncbi:Inositol oxygenase [Niveomyces insectorum RCEF 264]|uniref:Inositol oxygenase n=1 Tax=Niveomyces insectorum RCEF 264 TaxID=1081102 RepID=A0A167LWY4_9HYPO|nr:Inositol oxygenase [Niveomyces insectorum RCEF 264]